MEWEPQKEMELLKNDIHLDQIITIQLTVSPRPKMQHGDLAVDRDNQSQGMQIHPQDLTNTQSLLN